MAFVSFVGGHAWRWRHDRFESGIAGRNTNRVGVTLLRVGLASVLCARIGAMFGADPGSDGLPTWVLVVQGFAIPIAMLGVALVFVPELLNGTRRRHITPIDRATFPLLGVAVLSAMFVLSDPLSATRGSRAAETLFMWFRSLFSLHPQAEAMSHAPLVYQARGLVVLAILGLWPYTRLAGLFLQPFLHWCAAGIAALRRSTRELR